jgi:hypothetical protein
VECPNLSGRILKKDIVKQGTGLVNNRPGDTGGHIVHQPVQIIIFEIQGITSPMQ